MYPLISVGFQFVPSLVFALGCTAEQALAVLPAMLYPLVPDIAAGVLKKRDGILAVLEFPYFYPHFSAFTGSAINNFQKITKI